MLQQSKFEDIFSRIINENAPIREIRVTKPVSASWMTDEITFLMDLRDKYKNKWNNIKQSNIKHNLVDTQNDIFFYNRFKHLKNQVNHLIRKAKINDFNSKINMKLKDSKNFHFNLKKFNVVNSKNNQEVKCHLDPNKLNESFAKNNNAHISKDHITKMVKK